MLYCEKKMQKHNFGLSCILKKLKHFTCKFFFVIIHYSTGMRN